jgi:methylmalonyl-CoA mutase
MATITTAPSQLARRRHLTSTPARAIRILTAVPICDGHDSAIITVNLELVRHGIEVIYLGYHRSVSDVVRAALQEEVQAVGLSSYNGGHIEFFREVLDGLRRHAANHIGLFGGGGGTITPADARLMRRFGVDEIFGAGTSLTAMAQWVAKTYSARRPFAVRRHRNGPLASDLKLARQLTAAQNGSATSASPAHSPNAPVVGVTGPGGAGKSTLIDELAQRFLAKHPRARLAILAHDPGSPSGGALLGDRASMIYAQHNRVFMRSLSTRGRAGGLSTVTRGCLQALRHAGFGLVLVESAGIGQEALPFGRGLVDKQILVQTPEYGGGLQLHKIQMLDAANVVVVNKSDYAGARTALAELGRRLELNRRGQKLISTVARRHGDPGVDRLFEELCL